MGCFFLVWSVFAVPVGAQNAPKKPVAPVETRIGDVTLSGYRRSQGKLDGSGMQLIGPNTLVTVPDKASHSALRLHADTIRMQKEGRFLIGILEMEANVRFTVTQKTSRGTRMLEGTAGHSRYQRSKQQIELSGDVHLTLTDDVTLIGPGTLRAQRVVVDMSVTPYRYSMEGAPADNDLKFTPRPTEKAGTTDNAAKPESKPQIYAVHIHRFRSGAFQPTKQAEFEGGESAVELTDTDTKLQSRFQAAQMEAHFSERNVVEAASASGNVRYRVERPGKKEGEKQVVEGTGGKATYDTQTNRIELTGNVKATLTAPDSLLEPAEVVAEHVIAQVAKPYRYEVSGNPARNSVQFTPKPRTKPKTETPAEPKPNTPPDTKPKAFSIGTVRITGFESGVFAPGQEAEFHGEGTTFRSRDAKAKTTAQLKAARFVTTFAEDQSIARAEAVGTVHFHVEQPTATGSTLQTISGKSAGAVYTNTEAAQNILLNGPIDVQMLSDQFEGPAHLTGKEDATLKLNLATGEYDFESEKEDAIIEFQPKPAPKKPSATPIKPDKKKKP